jgi:acetoin utilization deacetylase AcuC-like enzyme
MSVAFISHSDCGRHDTGWGHPEHVGRLRAIPRALRQQFDLFEALAHLEGRHATEAEIILAHDAR